MGLELHLNSADSLFIQQQACGDEPGKQMFKDDQNIAGIFHALGIWWRSVAD